MRVTLALALCLAAVTAAPSKPERIIGGSVTTIAQYPSIVSLLFSWNSGVFWQTCAGTILNSRAIMSSAHCSAGDAASRWRVRVGSTFANSGGVIHNLNSILIHNNYDSRTRDNDIAIMRTSALISLNANVLPAPVATASHFIPDDVIVSAAGWGFTSSGGSPSEQLRHLQIQTINQAECIHRYQTIGYTITDNMLCSGWLDVGGMDRCQGDEGSPLFYNGIVIGVYSWGYGCADSWLPSVNVRVSRYTTWIFAHS